MVDGVVKKGGVMRNLLLAMVFALSACASVVPIAAPSPPPPAQPFAGADAYVPVRDFVYGGMALSETVRPDRPRAYILLDESRTKGDRRLCEAFMELPTAEGLINPAVKPVTTWWLTKEETAAGRSCEDLVGSYDYVKSTSVRASYGLGADGIYILAVDENHHAFRIDLTKANKKQMRNVMLLWLQAAATQAPAGSGVAITSDSFWDNLKIKICGGTSKSAMATLAGQAVAAGVTMIGAVAVVGKEVVCEALA